MATVRCAALLLAGAVCVSATRNHLEHKTAQQERDGWTASEEELVAEAKFIDELYSSNGIDNNYLDYKVYDASEYAATFTSKVDVVDSRSEQKDALRYCIFQTKGAYGEHFSNQKAWELAGLMTSRLRKHSFITKMERIEGEDLFAWEIISAPCGMSLHSVSGKVIVMQGFGVD